MLVASLLGLAVVGFALGISDPIEPEDWIVAGILFAIFFVEPLVVGWMSLRAQTWRGLNWVICGAMVWSAALVWIIRNG
jgi:hypothetical protein